MILVLTPVAQLMTVAMTNTDMETSTPSGWAFGSLFVLVLVVALVWGLSRWRLLGRRNLVLLYCMLTMAVPVMNLGFARPLLIAVRSVQIHFVKLFVNTYRTAYEAQSPAWFPVVPTADGLAWNQADRLLSLLRDGVRVGERERARRELLLQLGLLARQAVAPAGAAEGVEMAAAGERLAGLVVRLGGDEAAAVLEALGGAVEVRQLADSLGLPALLEERLATCQRASAAARAELELALRGSDEWALSYVPPVQAALDRGTRERLARQERERGDDELRRRVAALTADFSRLRQAATDLLASDVAMLRARLAAANLALLERLDDGELARRRTAFLYRLPGPARANLYAQDGRERTPRQDLESLHTGLSAELAQSPGPAGRSWWRQAWWTWQRIPWRLWWQPLCRWGLLAVLVYLFITCCSEWLREKWIERENLAFPAVEVIDHLIRHDCNLEEAEDPHAPPARRRAFSGVFWAGCAVGGLILGLEALGHYGVMGDSPLLAFDVSGKVFTAGVMREMQRVVLVLSPIVVGLLFLVGLEVSFSIWALFFVFKFAELFGGLVGGDLGDSAYTGWGGGRFYPFPMEQLLGASACFAVVLLWKGLRRRAALPVAELKAVVPFVPRRLSRWGMVLLPAGIAAMLWNLGIRSVTLLGLAMLLPAGLTLAMARARAETGLHTGHVTYEFAKLPMILGLTGGTGAKPYVAFVSYAFLPLTLLCRMLPQQLENLELARRNQVAYPVVAVASLAAFLTALAAGVVSLLVYGYYLGAPAFGQGAVGQGPASFEGIVHYPLWVSHFLGENGLDQFTHPHWIRLWFIGLGIAAFGLLTLARHRLRRFPFHPLGYLLILLSTYYAWVSPYYKGAPGLELSDASWLWGSAFVAWGIKRLIIKYGGMNSYRRAKPFFIGLVAGAMLCLFVVNLADLAASLRRSGGSASAGRLLKTFDEVQPYTPAVY